ncbi:MAG: hypothetical protein ACR2GP_13555, partial [Burkholderiaceae bacterium]
TSACRGSASSATRRALRARNVHYHEGTRVLFPAKQDAVAKAEDRLDVELDQDYCWMWTNKSGKSITVRLSMLRS